MKGGREVGGCYGKECVEPKRKSNLFHGMGCPGPAYAYELTGDRKPMAQAGAPGMATNRVVRRHIANISHAACACACRSVAQVVRGRRQTGPVPQAIHRRTLFTKEFSIAARCKRLPCAEAKRGRRREIMFCFWAVNKGGSTAQNQSENCEGCCCPLGTRSAYKHGVTGLQSCGQRAFHHG